MTSRRIEGHKNYYEVLRKHRRTSRLKKLIKLLILLIFFLALLFFSYNLLTKVDENNKAPRVNEPTTYTTSRPGDLFITYLNT